MIIFLSTSHYQGKNLLDTCSIIISHRLMLTIILTLTMRGSTLSAESDVYRHQILTTKVDPRAERVQIFRHRPIT